jgi:AcrR family transcriptional regulator
MDSAAAVITGRRSHADRRAESEQRLLWATATLVAERGTESTSLADIARAAGCSRGLPAYLFGSKQGLLMAVVEELLDRFRDQHLAPALADKVGLDAVVTTIRVFLQALENPLPATRAYQVLLGEAVGPQREFAVPINRLHRSVQQLFLLHLREALERGEIATDIDLEAHAWSLVSLIRGAGLLALADPEAFPLAAFIEHTVQSTERALAPQHP